VWSEETFLMGFFISWLGFTESRKDAPKSLLYFTKQTRKQKLEAIGNITYCKAAKK
jgi:hypothetical protein